MLLAGTVALTAAMLASLFLYQKDVSTVQFYGADLKNEKTQAFMHFLAKYGKMYATKSDLNTRYTIFSENYDKIQEHNSAPIERFTMGVNQFTDMTEEEFSKHYGQKGVQKKNLKQHP